MAVPKSTQWRWAGLIATTTNEVMGDTTLEVLIPKDTEIDFAYLLTSGDGLDPVDTASLHDQRSLLYFGMYNIVI